MLKKPGLYSNSKEAPKRSFWMGPVLGVFAALLFLLLWPDLFKNFEYRTLDFRFQTRKSQEPSKKIKIVGITDQDLEHLGQFPLKREIHELLINALAEYGTKSIVFDIQFLEYEDDWKSELEYLEPIIKSVSNENILLEYKLAQLARRNDFRLINATRDTGRVYHNYTLDVAGEPSSASKLKESKELEAWILERFGKAYREIDYGKDVVKGNRMILPIPELARAAKGLGFINIRKDTDGIIRRVPLIGGYDEVLYPSLDLIVVSDYLNVSWPDSRINYGKDIYLPPKSDSGKGFSIPIDQNGEMIVNFKGAKNYLQQSVSYLQVLSSYMALKEGKTPVIDLYEFQDSIVLIGMIAEGTPDIEPVSVNYVFPLVALHAQVIENIINNDSLRSVSNWMEILIIIILGFLMGCLLIKFSIWQDVALTIGILLCLLGFAWIGFNHLSLWIPVVRPGIIIVFAFITITVYSYLVEEKEKHRIRGLFGRYVSKDVLDEILSHPSRVQLGGEKKKVTVLFSDIRGFTKMSENRAPEQVLEMLNKHFGAMSDVIFEHQGTLDKFMGDAVMALFGAPIQEENDALRCVRAAIEMQKTMLATNDEFSIGIGINTGDVVVGNVGTEKKQEYTVIGDNVNLAFRLVAAAGPGQIIISESTYKEIKDHINCNPLPPIKVKGKTQPVKLYEVIWYGKELEK